MMIRPRMQFLRATEVKAKTSVQVAGGARATADKGDYIVVFPTDGGEERMVLKKAFFEHTHEDADDAVFCDICVDFDGVLHSYVSGWQGAAVITDPPVEGALDALRGYLSVNVGVGMTEVPLVVAVHSARSAQADGIQAMRSWIEANDEATRQPHHPPLVDQLLFPFHKPAAKVYLDDRGIRFEGTFPTAEELIHKFQVWNDAEKRKRIVMA